MCCRRLLRREKSHREGSARGFILQDTALTQIAETAGSEAELAEIMSSA
jgi:hypothetical protein